MERLGWSDEERWRDKGKEREGAQERDLEEVEIVFPWCFEEGWGLKAPEQRAVGEPIVLATDPDPLAHMNTREHTLAQQFI